MVQTNNIDLTPFIPYITSLIVGLLALVGTWLSVRPAVKRLNAEIDKLHAERDALNAETRDKDSTTGQNYLEMAEKVRQMAGEVYEGRISALEKAWDIDKEKMARFEKTIVDQFTIILRLLHLLRENKIQVPLDLQSQILFIYPPASPSDLFIQNPSTPPDDKKPEV